MYNPPLLSQLHTYRWESRRDCGVSLEVKWYILKHSQTRFTFAFSSSVNYWTLLVKLGPHLWSLKLAPCVCVNLCLSPRWNWRRIFLRNEPNLLNNLIVTKLGEIHISHNHKMSCMEIYKGYVPLLCMFTVCKFTKCFMVHVWIRWSRRLDITRTN